MQSPNVEEMVAACGVQGGKRGKDLLNGLLRRMQEGEPQGRELTIYFSPSDAVKDAALDESYLISCLLFLFLRFKALKLKLIPTIKPPPRPKKPDVMLRVRLCQEDFTINPLFMEWAQSTMRQSILELGEAAVHFEQLSIECGGDNAQGQPHDLLKRREETYEFMYHFYESLGEIFNNRRLFLIKNNVGFYCKKENLTSTANTDLHYFAQDAWIKRIIKLHEGFFINALILKARTDSIFQEFSPWLKEQEKQQDQQDEAKEEQRFKMGFFGGFSGSQCQYLSRLVLQFAVPSSLISLEKLLPNLPNLSHLRVTKVFQEMSLGNIDGILQTIARHNQLIEAFLLANIKVSTVGFQAMKEVYEQCPYLIEIEMNLPTRYLSDEGTQEERECGMILSAIHVRRISLQHNLEMAKLLISKHYNINEVIEIIDCIQPFTF